MSFTKKLKSLISSTQYDVVAYNSKTKSLRTLYIDISNYCIAWLMAQYALNNDRLDENNEFVFITPGKNMAILKDSGAGLYTIAKKLSEKYRA